MERFCGRCGQELKNGAAFCSHCGASVGGRNTEEKNAADMEWSEAAETLAKASLFLAKGFAVVLMGGAAAVCSLASVGMLGAAGYLFYCFASHGAVIFPWLLAGSLSGVSLLLSGLMAILIAVIFALATVSLAKCIHDFIQHSSSENQKGMFCGEKKESYNV